MASPYGDASDQEIKKRSPYGDAPVDDQPVSKPISAVAAPPGPVGEMVAAYPEAAHSGAMMAGEGVDELINAVTQMGFGRPSAALMSPSLKGFQNAGEGLLKILAGEVGWMGAPLAPADVGPRKLIRGGIEPVVEQATGSPEAGRFVGNLADAAMWAGLGIPEKPTTLGALSPEASAKIPKISMKELNKPLFENPAPKGTAPGPKPNAVAGSPEHLAAAQKLLDEGVVLTPGMRKGGTAKTFEDASTSRPIVGDIIKRGQRHAMESFNRVAINRALQPIGEALPDNVRLGHEAVDWANNKLSEAYDKLLPALKVTPDQQLPADIAKIWEENANLSPERKATLRTIIQDEVLRKFQQTPTGETAKNVESVLGQLSRDYQKMGHYEDRRLGEAFEDIQEALRGLIERSNPEYKGELQKINKGYANFKRVQRAAAHSRDGVFSPAQLDTAVKALDKSRDKSASARGKALMQDLSSAATKVLPSSVPDSGTPTRMLMDMFHRGVIKSAPGAIAGAPAAYLYNLGTMTRASRAAANPGAYGANALREMAEGLPKTKAHMERANNVPTGGTSGQVPNYVERAVRPGGQ